MPVKVAVMPGRSGPETVTMTFDAGGVLEGIRAIEPGTIAASRALFSAKASLIEAILLLISTRAVFAEERVGFLHFFVVMHERRREESPGVKSFSRRSSHRPRRFFSWRVATATIVIWSSKTAQLESGHRRRKPSSF